MDLQLASSTVISLLLVLQFVSGTNGARQVIKEESTAMINNVLKLHSMDVDHHRVLKLHRTDGKTLQMERTDPRLTLFYLMKEVKEGTKMTLNFWENTHYSPPPVLSKQEADAIPFSVKELPDILKFFSITEDSPQGKSMADTLKNCEAQPIMGETKTCATSFDSMVDFAHRIIGTETEIKPLTTNHVTKEIANRVLNFTIVRVKEVNSKAPKMVSCHTLVYPYMIYYCHSLEGKNKLFEVTVVAEENGEKVETIAVCHTVTNHFPPNHPSFRLLGVKPGTEPICHFFESDNYVWVKA